VELMEMPRCFSSSIQSDGRRALVFPGVTVPARWIALPLEQEFFRERRLARVGVRDDREGAAAGDFLAGDMTEGSSKGADQERQRRDSLHPSPVAFRKKGMRFLKYLGYFLGGLVLLIGALAVVVYFSSNAKFAKIYSVNETVLIVSDAARSSAQTHRPNARLHGLSRKNFGGKKVVRRRHGSALGPNLTRGVGGRVAKFSDEDWVRAIRHGFSPMGTASSSCRPRNIHIFG